MQQSRIPLIDEIRGGAILLMVIYHAGYDLVAIFGVPCPLFFSPGVNFLRDVMAGSFILISGCTCRLSRSNLRRGTMTFGCGLLMTAVTALVIPDQLIVFGVLHCLGACMLLFALAGQALPDSGRHPCRHPLLSHIFRPARLCRRHRLLYRSPAGAV